MTSKSLFFRLLGERAKQSLWLIALSVLTAFFAFPVYSAVLSDYMMDADRIASMAEESGGVLTTEACRTIAAVKTAESFYQQMRPSGAMLVFLLSAAAVICGMACFAYLFSKKKTDFFHSLPVKRELLFAVNYVSGILYTAVPYLSGLLAAAAIVQIKTAPAALDWGRILISFCQGMSFYILTYSTVVAAVMLTGHLAVGMLGTAVFFFWGPVTAVIIGAYYSHFFRNFCFMEGLAAQITPGKLSPVFFHMSASEGETGVLAFIALAAGVLIAGLSLYLYKKRPSESAGRAMAFKISRPVIKVLVMIPSALGASLFFASIGGGEHWEIFGLICGIVLSSCVIEVIYHFDFRKALAGKKPAAAGALISVFIFCLFRFDLAGYDTYVPQIAQIKSAAVICDSLYSGVERDRAQVLTEENPDGSIFTYSRYPNEREVLGQIHITDPQALESILQLAKAGVKNSAGESETVFQTDSEQERVVIQYHLKNGKTATRNYYMDIRLAGDAVEKIYNSRDFKKESYPFLKFATDQVAGANFELFSLYSHIELDREKISELLDAYQEEFYGLTFDEKKETVPLGFIQFKTDEMQNTIDSIRERKGDFTRFNDFAYYPVYPEFTKTVSMLREAGVEMADNLTPERIEKVVVKDLWYGKEKEDLKSVSDEAVLHTNRIEESSAEITEQKEIEEILKVSGPVGDLDSWKYDCRFDIEVYLSPELPENDRFIRDEVRVLNFSFIDQKVPEFILELFDGQI